MSSPYIAASDVVCSRSVNSSTVGTVHGWVESPNGRGTLDIVQTCVATVFLCTYTALFLNIHPGYKNRLACFIHKTKWVVFTLFCAEFTLSIAAEQWRSARQSTEDFAGLQQRLRQSIQQPQNPLKDHHTDLLARLETSPWTVRHAFFADMGGLRLQCPDFKPIPINAYQLLYLVEHGHLDYPCISAKTIWDRNKANTFTRVATMAQITWFTVQSIARGIQHVGLTTLELYTLAYAFCTIHTLYFWANKPVDVEEPNEISCNKKLADIITEAQKEMGSQQRLGLHRATSQYDSTPLDFIMAPFRLTVVDPFFWGIRVAFGQEGNVSGLPVVSFRNTETSSPHGLVKADIFWGFLFVLVYISIHLAAWDFPFPTPIEHLLWRICAISVRVNSWVYIFCCWPAPLFISKEHPSALELLKLFPRWLIRSFMWSMIITYFPSRAFIIVEGFVSLRSQPAKIYASINWWSFVPHL